MYATRIMNLYERWRALMRAFWTPYFAREMHIPRRQDITRRPERASPCVVFFYVQMAFYVSAAALWRLQRELLRMDSSGPAPPP